MVVLVSLSMSRDVSFLLLYSSVIAHRFHRTVCTVLPGPGIVKIFFYLVKKKNYEKK